MEQARTTKQKVLAVLVVAGLFIFIGVLFTGIGIVNHNETVKLQEKVKKQTEERHINEKLGQLSFSNFTFAKSPKSYLAVVQYKDQTKNLLNFNSTSTLPIASLTKLMTALVAIENLDLTQKFVAKPEFVGGDGTFNNLTIDEMYKARDLLSAMLIGSDNDSARLLTSGIGEDNFAQLMNAKARELGLTNTSYVNVTGLDPLDGSPIVNISSAKDLASLIFYIKEKHPEILKITQNREFNLCNLKQECKLVLSTNKLYTDPTFKMPILGGKTGQTDLALKNLALITEPINDIFLVTIVLGSQDHFTDTKTIFSNLNIKK